MTVLPSYTVIVSDSIFKSSFNVRGHPSLRDEGKRNDPVVLVCYSACYVSFGYIIENSCNKGKPRPTPAPEVGNEKLVLFLTNLFNKNCCIRTSDLANAAGNTAYGILRSHRRRSEDTQLIRPDQDVFRALLFAQAAAFTKFREQMKYGFYLFGRDYLEFAQTGSTPFRRSSMSFLPTSSALKLSSFNCGFFSNL